MLRSPRRFPSRSLVARASVSRGLLSLTAGSVALACVAGCTGASPSTRSASAHSSSSRPANLASVVAPVPRVAASRPTGAGIVRFEDLSPKSTMGATAASAPDGDQVSFAARTFRLRNFKDLGDTTYAGIAFDATVGGIRGSGVNKTIFELVPRTSSRARLVPLTFPDTNQLYLMRVTADHVRLSGFTLQATNQGHLYNGLRIHRVASPRVSQIKVVGVPGDDDAPPGETFGINDYRSTHAIYDHVEIDGAGVGGAGFGANGSSNILVKNSSFHDNRYSMGATFWHVKNITITDSSAVDNGYVGFNFERVSGTVTVTRPTTHGNTRGDFRIASDQGSATYRIVDPKFSGKKLTIVIPKTYYGHPNLQKKSQIHVIVRGVDRTKSLVRFVTK